MYDRLYCVTGWGVNFCDKHFFVSEILFFEFWGGNEFGSVLGWVIAKKSEIIPQLSSKFWSYEYKFIRNLYY